MITPVNEKVSQERLRYLCLQDVGPTAEAVGETWVVGAKSSLLNLYSSRA